jgi:hypothetical protein
MSDQKTPETAKTAKRIVEQVWRCAQPDEQGNMWLDVMKAEAVVKTLLTSAVERATPVKVGALRELAFEIDNRIGNQIPDEMTLPRMAVWIEDAETGVERAVEGERTATLAEISRLMDTHAVEERRGAAQVALHNLGAWIHARKE